MVTRLTVDVGNTETVLGVFRGLEPLRCWRLATDRRRTGDELRFLVEGMLERVPEDVRRSLRRATVASVVPPVDRVWGETLEALDLDVLRVDARTELPIRLEVDEPETVGADRVANTLACRELYEGDTVVVDLGTATTFDCVAAGGAFRGGVIAPGPRAGMERLAETASKLPQAEIEPPGGVIGRNTEACLESGIFYSVVDGIDGIVGRILEEWEPEDPLVVATGGLADVLGGHCRRIERIEPYLTLTGLAAADRHVRPAGAATGD